ncbi:hypothetical protein HWQ67_12050 [Candidatus Magnetobacterium casensis]|uniref:Uncharacterized protein n=1 Tax=Candidatus Magnetobacterium casense TaxID=1455061 RepID=A0ABS6S0C6_9BACT|nr:hypothetical protein [Candidatus Magnetobacterium casensis]
MVKVPQHWIDRGWWPPTKAEVDRLYGEGSETESDPAPEHVSDTESVETEGDSSFCPGVDTSDHEAEEQLEFVEIAEQPYLSPSMVDCKTETRQDRPRESTIDEQLRKARSSASMETMVRNIYHELLRRCSEDELILLAKTILDRTKERAYRP